MTFSIPSSEYSEEYFLTECDGFYEFRHDKFILPSRLRTLWNVASISDTERVLDIGCGRGEILAQCAQEHIAAVGLDYSDDALKLTSYLLNRLERDRILLPLIIRGNAIFLPLANESFDVVIMSDIVEHLYPHELLSTLQEVHRILKASGRLVIHTMPNLWYYRYGYPLYRLLNRLRGKRLPRDPRARFRFSHVHVNEQTPWKLRRILHRAGFVSTKVLLIDYREYSEHPALMRSMMKIATHSPVIRQIFCDDIFVVARKTR